MGMTGLKLLTSFKFLSFFGSISLVAGDDNSVRNVFNYKNRVMANSRKYGYEHSILT